MVTDKIDDIIKSQFDKTLDGTNFSSLGELYKGKVRKKNSTVRMPNTETVLSDKRIYPLIISEKRKKIKIYS